MKIRRDIKCYIEAELRDYHETIKSIQEDRNELIYATPIFDNNGGGRSNMTSDPTLKKTISLMTNKRIRRMEQTVSAISSVVDALPEEKYKLIKLKYWTNPQPLTDTGIAMGMHMGKTAFYNWVNDILFAIGVEMGLLNINSAEKERSFGA